MSTPQLIGAAFIAVPIVFALLMLVILRQHRRIDRSFKTVPAGWVPSEGIVVDEEHGFYGTGGGNLNGGSSTSYMRTPTVRYRTHDGRDVTFRSTLRSSTMPRPGTVVTVYYDPQDPNRARIGPESLRDRRFAVGATYTIMAILFTVFATMFVGAGYLIIKVS